MNAAPGLKVAAVLPKRAGRVLEMAAIGSVVVIATEHGEVFSLRKGWFGRYRLRSLYRRWWEFWK